MTIVAMNVAAQSVTTHTVKRGETIESIASKYQVSVDDIKRANPNAGDFFYVGMKLNIPSRSDSSVIKNNASGLTDSSVATEKETIKSKQSVQSMRSSSYSEESSKESKANTWHFAPRIGWDLYKVKDYSTYSLNFEFLLGPHYYLTDNIYLSSGLGLMYGEIDTSTRYNNKTNKNIVNPFSLMLPLEVGTSIYIIPNRLAFRAETGVTFAYALFGKVKTNDGNTSFSDIDDIERFGSFYRIAAGIDIPKWDLGLMFHFSIPLSSKSINVAKDSNFFGVSFMFEN